MAGHWVGVSPAEDELWPTASSRFFAEQRTQLFATRSVGISAYQEGRPRARTVSDGETRYQVLENVRGADVFVVQPCSNPVDFHLMQLLLMIDAFKRASAWRITPVIPYYPYARQDRKDRPRVAFREAGC